MRSDLIQAKSLLKEGGHTCVLCLDGDVLASDERGVKPLLMFLESGADYSKYCAADRVVGKAAAFLYEKLCITHVYAQTVSEAALEVFVRYGCEITYDVLVPRIKNRAGDGFCPMESAVRDIDCADDALRAILETRRKMGLV
ncbi:MAG: DUF1893 domain-containing protein [Lachnospiraceae bacterium]|nr:DUF1893 domain-containing protein [Lachnospiraceae bacterium]